MKRKKDTGIMKAQGKARVVKEWKTPLELSGLEDFKAVQKTGFLVTSA